MERWAPRLVHLDAREHFNMTLNSSDGHVHWAERNSTKALIAGLQLQKVQMLRTTHLTIGAISLVMAVLTVWLVVSDARRVGRMQGASRTRGGFLRSIHPAEIFSLVLASGAAMQQIIFVAVQGSSLSEVLSDQCRGLAMVTFPAIFLTGYITLVFGIEMAIRAFKPQRFAPRSKWNVIWCIGIVSFLLFLTWLPTIIWPMSSRCLGSLIWFPARYALIAVNILSVLVFSLLALAVLIGVQLKRTTNVDPNERIAASRMCCFLLVVALVYILILPVEIQAYKRDFINTTATSRIAEVSLFASGLLVVIFHLFLRTNALRMVISPTGKDNSQERPAQQKRKRPRIRFFGPSDLELNISGPVDLQRHSAPPESRRDSRQGLIVREEKNRFDFDAEYFQDGRKEMLGPQSPGSVRSLDTLDLTKWPLPPEPVTPGTKEMKEVGQARAKSAYSLFPTRADDIPRLPATVYSPPKLNVPRDSYRVSKLAMRRQRRRSSAAGSNSANEASDAFSFLAKPPPLFGGRHGRNQSTDSSATVQIGLRFSVAPATLAAAKCTAVNRQMGPGHRLAPPLRRDNSESSGSSGTSLGLPIQIPSTTTTTTTPSENTTEAGSNSSSSANLSAMDFPQPPQRSDSLPTYAHPPPYTSPPPSAKTSLEVQRGKALPPTPRSAKEGSRKTVASPPASSPTQPPPQPPPLPAHPRPGMSGLRMNPVSPKTPQKATTGGVVVGESARRDHARSPPPVRSPTARMGVVDPPMGGPPTMSGSRSPPPHGWI